MKMAMKVRTLMVILGLQFITMAAAAAETQSAQSISESGTNHYASGIVDHSTHSAVTVINVENYGAVGDGKHDSTQAFVRAWYVVCRKSPAILLVPANKKFAVHNLLLQGLCQTVFIFKVDGMTAAPQNPEREKNINKCLQFAKLKRSSVMGRGVIDGQGEKLWTDQCKWVNDQPTNSHFFQALSIEKQHRLSKRLFHSNKMQTSVAAVERVVKGRTLLEPPKPKILPGGDPEHN